MKNNFLYLFLVSLVIFTSCEEEVVYRSPSVTTTASPVNLPFGSVNQKVNFTVSVDPALTATYTTTTTNATVQNASGSVSGGTVELTFDAGTTAGAASITLNVTDSQNQTSQATYVFTVESEVKEVVLTSNITSNTTWTSDKTYILAGRIVVESGSELTIQPGTVIKGQAGTGANATALIIARGAKINAAGTATRPIIFTSVADEITGEDIAAGRFRSPNLDPTVNGLWGGVIVLGRARISASNSSGDVSEVQIEGIPTSDPNGLYGGNDDADNSGVIRYISIRHGGTNIGNGNEINGLTLGGVGSGTVIENIEVVANQDDGVEWFGGSVNVKNVVVWNCGDDGIDTDQSWSGTLDNFAVITVSGHCFELDGPEGSYAAGHTIKNGFVNAAGSEDLINVDNNSIVALQNIYITGIAAGQRINRVTAAGVSFTDILLNVTAANLPTHVNGAVPAGVRVGTTSTADLTAFAFSWASQADAIK